MKGSVVPRKDSQSAQLQSIRAFGSAHSLTRRTIGHVRINPAARQETRNSTFLPRCHLSVAAFYVTRRLRDLDGSGCPVFLLFSLSLSPFFYFFLFSRSFRRIRVIFNAPTLDKNDNKSPGRLLVFLARPIGGMNDLPLLACARVLSNSACLLERVVIASLHHRLIDAGGVYLPRMDE